VFITNLSWGYNGTLDSKISPLYQSIRYFDTAGMSSGAGDANYFELILVNFLSHFSKLMEVYQTV